MPDAQGHYTWPEFRQKTGKGPQDYQKYQRYVTNVPKRRAAARAAAALDPLKPTPQAVQNQQAISMANFAYNPQIQAQQQQAKQQQEMFSKAMTQYTAGLAGALPKGDVAYGWARQQAGDVAASAAALGQNAQGQAAQGQGAMSDYLRNISAPDASQHFATDVGGRGNFTAGNLATIAQAGQENILNKGGGLAQFVSALPRIAAIGGRSTLKSGLQNLSAKNIEALAGLRGDRGKAIAGFLQDSANRELSKGVAGIGIEKTAVTEAGKNARAVTAAQAKVTAARVAAANKAGSLKTLKNGALVSIAPNGTVTQLMPPGSMPVPKAGTGAGNTSKEPNRVSVENATFKKAGETALAQAQKTKTITVPDTVTGFGTVTKKVPFYTKPQLTQIIFNQMWTVLKRYPGYTTASVRAMAKDYADAAYTGG